MLYAAYLFQDNKIIDSRLNNNIFLTKSYLELLENLSNDLNRTNKQKNILVNILYNDCKECYVYDNEEYSVVLITYRINNIIAYRMISEIISLGSIQDKIFQKYNNIKHDKIKKNIDENVKITYKTIDQKLDYLNNNSKNMIQCCIIL